MLDQPCFFDRTSLWRVAPLEYGADFDGLEGVDGAGLSPSHHIKLEKNPSFPA